MRAPGGTDVAVGDVLLSVENVSLSFGGVKAISDVSFDIRKGEIRAIIGPNGAGKTSMLNVINGFYHPQQGRVTFKNQTRREMRPYEAAYGGIARTFQNVALFRGMTALDNIMAGRTLKMHSNFFWQMLRYGPAMREEVEHRRRRRAARGRRSHAAFSRSRGTGAVATSRTFTRAESVPLRPSSNVTSVEMAASFEPS